MHVLVAKIGGLKSRGREFESDEILDGYFLQ